MGPSQISDTPLQGFAILDVEFCELYRFGLTRALAPQKVFFLISMERSAEKGIHRSERQVPVKNVCFTSCLHILAWHVFIDSPLEFSSFRLPLRWLYLPTAVL